jgi:Predicted membrane protein (DUF2207) C-terminal domain/Predicted membrane protein (DUF2207) N-terminal domain
MSFRWASSVFVLLLLTTSALAGDPDPTYIDRIHAELTFRADGSLLVTESITLRGKGPFRELVRVVPLLSTGNRDPRGPMTAKLISVTDRYEEGPGYQVLSFWDRFEVHLSMPHQAGAPGSVILEYEVQAVPARVGGEDILYWPLIGFRGAVEVDRITAVVRMPKEVPVEATRFTIEGMAGGWRFHRPGEKPAWAESLRGLGVDDGFTVVVRFPSGYVEQPSELYRAMRYAFRFRYALGLGALLSTWLLIWFFRGRDVLRGVPRTLPAEEPPPEVGAAEAGVIADTEFNARDAAAAVLDLAEQGHLRIEVTGEDTPFFTLHAVEKYRGDLRSFERSLLEALFRNRRTSAPLTGLRQRFGGALVRVEDRIMSDLAERGFFRRSPRRTLSTANAAAGICVMLLLLTGILMSLRFISGPLLLYWLIALPSIFLILHIAGRMPSRTRAGLEVRARLAGFRSRVLESPEPFLGRDAERLFYRAFPFAVALGAGDGFVSSCAPMPLSKPQWLEAPEGRWSPDLLLLLADRLTRELGHPGPALGRRAFTWASIPRYLWRP